MATIVENKMVRGMLMSPV